MSTNNQQQFVQSFSIGHHPKGTTLQIFFRQDTGFQCNFWYSKWNKYMNVYKMGYVHCTKRKQNLTSVLKDSGGSSSTSSIKNEPEHFFCLINSGKWLTSIGARKLSRNLKSMCLSDVILNVSRTKKKQCNKQTNKLAKI